MTIHDTFETLEHEVRQRSRLLGSILHDRIQYIRNLATKMWGDQASNILEEMTSFDPEQWAEILVKEWDGMPHSFLAMGITKYSGGYDQAYLLQKAFASLIFPREEKEGEDYAE